MNYIIRKQTIQRIFSSFLLGFILCLCLFSPLTVLAENTSDTSTEGKSTRFLYDNGNLFTKDQKTKLKKKCKKINNLYDINAIILTDDITDNDPITSVEDFYDANASELNDAVILYINMTSRDVRIDGFGACQYIFDNSTIDSILDEITPYLADEDCYNATINFLNNVNDFAVIDASSNTNGATHNSSNSNTYSSNTSDYENQGNDSDESSNESINLSFGQKTLIALGISILIGGISVGVMVHNSSAKMTATGSTYLDPRSARILGHWDRYLRTTTTRIPKPKDDDNNHTPISSGGNSHSGGGRSF